MVQESHPRPDMVSAMATDRVILFTQSLQNDFVRKVAPGEPLPNLLHVGREESRRGPAA